MTKYRNLLVCVLTGLLLVTVTSLSHAQTKHGIRSIDFRNFTYHPSIVDESVHARNGKYEDEETSFTVGKVIYGDLTNDGQEEAVVTTIYEMKDAANPANSSFPEGYIYTMNNGEATLLGKFDVGEIGYRDYERYLNPRDKCNNWIWGAGGVQSIQNGFVVFALAVGGRYCPTPIKYDVTLKYKWDGTRFVLVGKPIKSLAKQGETKERSQSSRSVTPRGRRQATSSATPAAPRPTTVASDFLSQLGDAGPRGITLDKLTVVNGYALQNWSDENTGGQALLKFSPSTGTWVLVVNTGGALDVDELVTNYGVPRAVAALLVKRSLEPSPPPRRRASSGLPDYRTYIGKDLNDLLRGVPDVNRRLKKLLGSNYQLFMKNLSVSSELQDEQGFLKMHGLAPHMGTVEEAVFLLSFSTGKLHCAILSARFGRRYKLFSEDPNSAPTPLLNQLIYR